MLPDDIPIPVTCHESTADSPFYLFVSETAARAAIAQHWDAIEAHIREQIAQEITDDVTPVPWGLVPMGIALESWIDRRDAEKAAWIALGCPTGQRPYGG